MGREISAEFLILDSSFLAIGGLSSVFKLLRDDHSAVMVLDRRQLLILDEPGPIDCLKLRWEELWFELVIAAELGTERADHIELVEYL